MLIVDFYVDEPSCLGVPPYLSPYVRYAAGALASAGIPQEQIQYLTVDQWREAGKELFQESELVLLVGGHTVPGKYLGGKIGTVSEILEFLEYRQRRQRGSLTLLGGPIRHAPRMLREKIEAAGGILIRGDLELYAHRIASHPGGIRSGVEEISRAEGSLRARRDYASVDRWAEAGAFISTIHPNFPYLMVELETYRGCTREEHCSFCTEALYGRPEFRSQEGVGREVAELYRMGNRYFRLGRQADLLTYLPESEKPVRGFPVPSPESVEHLYRLIREGAPDLKVLHLDNINPGTIAAHPEQSRRVIEAIVRYGTPGDTAAMGLESVDPAVIEKNRLKAGREEALHAVEMINEIGSIRSNGIPHLLPGLNFLQGLPGESPETFRMNFEFLQEIRERGLILRRINIRRVESYEKTPLEKILHPAKQAGVLEKRFVYYRDRIRSEIDHVMLERSFPRGTVLREVHLEARQPGFLLGRTLGSYPVTIKIPESDQTAAEAFQTGQPVDAMVTGAEERSLSGITYPVAINRLDRSALRSLPGVGKKRADSIAGIRPLRDFNQLTEICEHAIVGSERDYDFS